ncbi:ABC-type polysaccharide/polyol phosphate transport system ATPase subunit [Breznakia sp. PF5-3]|uniref:ABC transporter ATP-binding protein n=1 Tax=unclassified Breznakia TaxID=2623764 RepID=UPI00240644FB|nr:MULTISPECIES: ABC transporter ATP-binding protein [unclassified Breznakia]MDF9824980.1 ABC-type polysaccharide/polyol phosphate transport system ATPase subunit [Breznakia sp. PM6-1]MDF9835827.1 ABC-type polysaccharide/polyol phosphate transport system ATPase subunit [Breznakia sp. PF5-3]MDF9836921.1 ABC-type polysaccharide/polyol phosphate transport system ATPase subunit [Breznakia sp. PFB2-8]MDF9859867.1 ABC-type polysaccharide/polyol phosphate transport system ATPase subunit [Breznakia sp.
MKNDSIAIKVTDMNKDFKRVYDKPQTLKENLVFWKKEKSELHHVLQDINIEIKKGETVSLIGSNGSGKSTLLKLMTKILYPTSGTIETFGKLTSLLELGAGFHPDFTGRENIYFNAAIFGLTRQEIDKRVDEIIEFSELDSFIDNPIRTYSSGMYMRLAFSIAINVDAEILLIDEILAVGDQHFQDKCYAKLEELRDSNKTIVIVSHSLDVVKALCDRAIWIYHGKVSADGDPITVIDSYLERINADYLETLKAKSADGEYIYQANAYIDEPIANSVYELNETDVYAKGWVMCEDSEAVVKCYLDKKEISGIEREKRPDVLRVYSEKYGGAYANENPGWKCPLKIDTLEIGRHIFEIQVFDKNGNQLISKKTNLFVKE